MKIKKNNKKILHTNRASQQVVTVSHAVCSFDMLHIQAHVCGRLNKSMARMRVESTHWNRAILRFDSTRMRV
jgi:hypothetical protein